MPRFVLLLFIVTSLPVFAADENGWRPLFNGKDLTGWVPVQVAPNTFTVRDGIIVSTGVPTGVMRTDRQYENFELELEWKHVVPGGNAGLFVWSYPITAVGQPFTKSIEVQILDGRNSDTYTSHGDIFSIHGARMTPDRPHPRGAERCLPSEFRCKPAGEWNHYRVVCNNGVIKLSVNGKEVSGGSAATPRKGYICLESEGTECHFRNIRIKELPSTNPKPEEIAPLADGFFSIYNGLNLDGWTSKEQGNWKANDWILEYDGKGTDADLWFNKPLRDFEMIVDWRVAKQDAMPQVAFALDQVGENIGLLRTPAVGSPVKPGVWTRSTIKVKDRDMIVITGPAITTSSLNPAHSPGERRFGLEALGHPIEFANIYLKERPAKEPKPEASLPPEGFVPLFNGRNLDGWTTRTPGDWKANDGVLEYEPNLRAGEVAQILETTRSYRDFIMMMDFRGKGREGRQDYFPHSREVDIYVRGGGPLTVLSVAENDRINSSFSWNRAVVTAKGNRVTVEVNGRVLPEANNVQLQVAKETGPIGILAVMPPVELANIYIKELPADNSKPEASLSPAGFVPLFNGRDLDGWEVLSQSNGWKVNGSVLENHSGHSALISATSYCDYELVFDWRIPNDDPHQNAPYLYIDRGPYSPGAGGKHRNGVFLPDATIPPNLVGSWNRSRVTVKGDHCVIEINDRVVRSLSKLSGGTDPGKIGFGRDGARLDLANIYIKELK